MAAVVKSWARPYVAAAGVEAVVAVDDEGDVAADVVVVDPAPRQHL